MSSVRRRFGRFERQLPVVIEAAGRAFSGETVNIGLGGLCARTAFSAAFDTPVVVRFSLPEPPMDIECHGKVMWSQATGDTTETLGVSFETLRPLDVWGLLQYFNASSKAPAAVTLSDTPDADA